MSFIIGADIVPAESNLKSFNTGNMQDILDSDLLNLLIKFNYRIFNLECPLVDENSPIKKCGAAFKANTSVINGIKSLGVDLLTLANNHIMDQGSLGLESTINTLKNANISFFGAGVDLENASKPFVFCVKGKKIGVYACAEHEFSIAGINSPGANPYDPLESFDHIEKIKKTCDYVIVLYHGGKEHYRYPSPLLQKICRKFIEKGANLVVCQHSHCIGCEEKYLSGTIVYGQGNFLFSSCTIASAQTSLLVAVDDSFVVSYVPLIKTENGVCLAKGDQAEQIISDFHIRSNQIKQNNFVEDEYTKFATKMLNHYLLKISGNSHKKIKMMLNKLFNHRLTNFLGKNYYSEEELLAIRNFIECEAHRELIIRGLCKK